MADDTVGRKVAEIFADTVRVARHRRRWTQAELAHRAGVGTQRISEIETGALDPRLSLVQAVAGVLGIDVTITERAA